MPYCAPCEKYHTPSALDSEGRCPGCGETIADPASPDEAESEKAPWHFKLLVAGVVVYLGWRTVQMIGWAL